MKGWRSAAHAKRVDSHEVGSVDSIRHVGAATPSTTAPRQYTNCHYVRLFPSVARTVAHMMTDDTKQK